MRNANALIICSSTSIQCKRRALGVSIVLGVTFCVLDYFDPTVVSGSGYQQILLYFCIWLFIYTILRMVLVGYADNVYQLTADDLSCKIRNTLKWKIFLADIKEVAWNDSIIDIHTKDKKHLRISGMRRSVGLKEFFETLKGRVNGSSVPFPNNNSPKSDQPVKPLD